MLDPIAKPFGRFLYFIYDTIAFENYGLAIIIFTLIIRLLLLPLTLKQMKSTSKMQELQPKLQEIQKRYKNDKQKLNQETMRLYQENKVNPAGGCLPLLVQMPILISLYWVITSPLKYMLRKSGEAIQFLIEYVPDEFKVSVREQLDVMNYFNLFPEKITEVSQYLKESEIINLNFLGLRLGYQPTIDTDLLFGAESYIYLPLLLIPVIGVITTYISSKMMQAKNIKNKKSDTGGAGGGMANTMLYIGPVLTLIFSFQLPAGVGLYWIAGYVFQIFQQLYINKYVTKKED